MQEKIQIILRQTVDEYGKVYEVLAAKKILNLIEQEYRLKEPPEEIKAEKAEPETGA